MSRTVLNTIANFVGLASTSGLTLFFSIIYFRILGSENFGLVSFCTTVLLIGNLFADLGLGRTVVREISRREHDRALGPQMRDTLFTLQSVHFGLAFLCGVAIALSSSWLAANWLHRDAVGIGDATRAITLLGIVAASQLPRELCRSALTGLQRQVLMNALGTIFSALRGLATIGALYWIAPRPDVFLAVQVAASILETGTLLIAVWTSMPNKEHKPHFDVQILRDIASFAINDGLGVILGVGMYLGDRLLLSRLLPLDVFGNYSLAIMIAEMIMRIAGPFSTAYFPHFSDLVARKNEPALAQDYDRVSVVISALLAPATLVLIVFPTQILELVTGHPAIAVAFAPVLALRALGNAIISLIYLPHTLQLAAGVSSTAFYVNILNVCIYLPGILFFTPIYGYIAPAVLWVVIVSIQTPIMIIVTHRIALKGQAWSWVKESILAPALISAAILGTSTLFAPNAFTWFSSVFWAVTPAALAMAAVLLLSDRIRPIVLDRVAWWRERCSNFLLNGRI